MEHDFKETTVRGEDLFSSFDRTGSVFTVKNYDFKRPDKFSKEQIRTMCIIHETFARLTINTLTALIQKKVDIHVSCVDQMTYTEFIQSIPDPSLLSIIGMTPLRGSAVLQIDPSISSLFIDRILGGSGQVEAVHREASPLELPLAELIVSKMLGNLNEAWWPVVKLESSLGQMETNPQFAQIVPPTEMIVLISLKVETDQAEGFINLCIPYLTIEPLMEKLSAKFWYSMIRTRQEDCIPAGEITSLKLDCEVLTEAEELSLRHIGELKKGSLIRLPHFDSGQTFLRAGGEKVMDCLLKKGRGRLDLKIQESSLKSSGLIPDLKREKAPEPVAVENQMEDFMKQIAEKIDKLTDSQEHLSDQVFFQAEGEPSISEKKVDSFSFIGLPDLPVLYELLSEENPQAVALILSRLDSGLSAELLGRFEGDRQPDLIRRIGKMERISPEVLEAVNKSLRDRLVKIAASPEPDQKGVEKIVQILNVSSRSVESHVIQTLDEIDVELSEEIKKRMFVFEDMVLLDGNSVRKVTDRSDIRDLCLAMKTVADDGVKDHILTHMEKNRAAELKKCLDDTGRVRISDVDKAQQRVIEVIKELEELGELVVARIDELVD